ncbi:MAG TPA: Tex-like N-terminal domain-containing protein [Synergistales bacterium]|nr:Tex-like N-terminal domain-containing protein [Synergistales bacterium]
MADPRHASLIAAELGISEEKVLDTGVLLQEGCSVPFIARYRKEATGSLDEVAVLAIRDRFAQLEELARGKVCCILEEHPVEAVAVGNGTAGRETMAFLGSMELPGNPGVILVNESGASIYSASKIEREEFPDRDVTVRGSVSIGRRLQDPLAELVKIDPKSIGVGQYQHDVDQKKLTQSLEDVVVSCVNFFGVFVDVGAHQDGLVHVSQMSGRFVKNPMDLVKAGQKVRVSVLDVDLKRRRISLAMKGVRQGPS